MARKNAPTPQPPRAPVDYTSRAKAIASFRSIKEALAKIGEDARARGPLADLQQRLAFEATKGHAAHERVPLRSPPDWDYRQFVLGSNAHEEFTWSFEHYVTVTDRLVSLLEDDDHWSNDGIETATKEATATGEMLATINRLTSGLVYSLDAVITAVWQHGRPAGVSNPLPDLAATIAPFASCVSVLWTTEENQSRRAVAYADALVAVLRSLEHYIKALKQGIRACTDWNPSWLNLVAQFRERYNEWLPQLERHLSDLIPSRAPTFDRLDDVQNLRFGASAPLLTSGTFGAGEQYTGTEAIRQIIKTATSDVLIVDNWSGGDTLALVFAAPVAVTARVLTERILGDYAPMAVRFRRERGNTALETKQSARNIHDRYLVIDGSTYYHLGASIKDLGKSLFSFTRKTDAAEVATIQALLAAAWTSATVVP